MKKREEKDSIGSIYVPGDKYWGASTERSKKYLNVEMPQLKLKNLIGLNLTSL